MSQPTISDLKQLSTEQAGQVKRSLGDAPIIPVGLILIGGYLAYFSIHWWRDQHVIWPSQPVQAILRGESLPAATPEPTIFSEIETSAEASESTSSSDALNATTPGSGNPSQNQNLGKLLAGRYGWSGTDFADLVLLWNRESGWNANARNPNSGAYGIAQALGHGTAETAAADGTNEYGPDNGISVATAKAANGGSATAQIEWGLAYIKATYGSPSAAWAHETAYGWY
jgi:hypothetical protein